MRTIIAQCTPIGSGSLAVLRLSGPDSIAIADRIGRLASGQLLCNQAANTVHYGRVVKQQPASATAPALSETVDQVVFTLFRAPRSFTGADTVEISCHNNQLIVGHIIALALQAGASLAQRGEFSAQAFLNRKLDLTQAEALNELIHAQTAAALQKSLAQLQGSLSQWLAGLEAQLMQALALTEASFEFLDEELEFGNEIRQILATVTADLIQLQQQFSQDQQLRTGIKITLIGPPNAGKSALFNALLQQERAIVADQPGTTRDTIEAGITCGEYWVTFIDTAGLRVTTEKLEQLGIARSYAAAQAADLILLVIDGTRPLTTAEQTEYQAFMPQYGQKMIVVLNKCDLVSNLPANGLNIPPMLPQLAVSALQQTNLAALKTLISSKIQLLLGQNASPFLVNQRHQAVISELLRQLPVAQAQLAAAEIPYELLAVNLNQALQTLVELSGKSISEQAMDRIFREFCVGK
ncbi:MAG TPA: tRNA uridine-5-carboxymethylaminomethyl(34) synthesis GTPase MnmE [Candidatus Babeliales bacterium]|nr:tRNA uridine-5-carboxymethylaminomethyl(34) synthesis GTPase MnmE [Candidatus Babeliales bacterium]